MVGSSFSGLGNNNQLTDEDLIRAIRFAAAGDYEAAQPYIQFAESIDNKLVAKVLTSVADLKREQMVNFLNLPYELAQDEEKSYAMGSNEVEDGYK